MLGRQVAGSKPMAGTERAQFNALLQRLLVDLETELANLHDTADPESPAVLIELVHIR